MATNMKAAQELIFGAQGLGASNFKMMPGTNRDVTPEQVAGQLLAALNEPLRAEDELVFE